MMKTNPINVFLIDDELPLIDDFRQREVYNSAISATDLYHLAINTDWQHLDNLRQLIVDIVTSDACKEGLINLVGFTTPTQAFPEIEKGLLPDIVIYDWEYVNSGFGTNSKDWLLDILNKTKAFVFVYSKRRDELPPFLNSKDFNEFSPRFQLFLKGGKRKASFSAEEFILQFIIGAAKNSGKIKIAGIDIEFASNEYLSSATDLLYLQRILGDQYILDQLPNINFSIDTASVEKILNDSNQFLLFNEEKGILITPENLELKEKLGPLVEIKYLDVIKRFSLSKLEEVLERGVLII